MSERVIMIVQARMGSTRLPGKSMMDLAGSPLIGRILERVKRCSTLDDIVLAIPDTYENDPLAEIANALDVSLFRGSEDDLVERYYQAAKGRKADYVVRLPGDNPVPEPAEIDRIVIHHRSLGGRGFSSNLSPFYDSGYPDGIGAEVFDFSLLEEAFFRKGNSSLREHVHLNFFDYTVELPVDSSWCPVSTIICPELFRRPDLTLDVNTMEQYLFINKIYNHLYPLNPNFHITDIVSWYDKVYLKSL